MTIDFQCGDYRDIFDKKRWAHTISDNPFSKKTQDGWNAGAEQCKSTTGQHTRMQLLYPPWGPYEVREWVHFVAARSHGWVCAYSDDILSQDYRSAFAEIGDYHFPAVSVLINSFRALGDGPSSGMVYLMVARPRSCDFIGSKSKWGGVKKDHYSMRSGKPTRQGGKTISHMLDVCRDYTRPGDVVVDTCAGHGSTLIAAHEVGCHALGYEIDADVHSEGLRIIEARKPPLWSMATEQNLLSASA